MTPVHIFPAKRFGDETELLSIADLNDAGAPVMKVNANSIGTAALVYQDVFDLISEASLGVRQDYVFDADMELANGNNTPVTIAVPVARAGDPIKCSPVRDPDTGLDIDVQFWAECRTDGIVTLNIHALASTTLAAGSVVTIIVFTPRRLFPGQGNSSLAPLVMAPADSTGYLTVTPGYAWKTREGITAAKLDLTAQPKAAIPDHSVGRREIDPNAIARIVASVRGGTLFSGSTPFNITLTPGGAASFPISLGIPIALGAIPVVAVVAPVFNIFWGGYVDPVNTLNIVLRNEGTLSQAVPRGTSFRGRLL